MGTTMNKLIRSLSSAAFEPDDEQVDDIQSIDISSISISSSILMKNPLSRIGEYNDSDLNTGIIGEQIIYEYLSKKYHYQSDSVSIKWENRHGESHLPYDILLTKHGKKHYIEVKLTRTYNQH
ncbi:unnamed protein product [Rotaria sp. Silwood2]|nr:unnamed protein product [Rotaria sp. Silwood2]